MRTNAIRPSLIALNTDAVSEVHDTEAIEVMIDGHAWLVEDFKIDHHAGEPRVTLVFKADNVIVKP